MTLKVVTNMGQLLRLARAEGDAEQALSKDPTLEREKAYQRARAAHEAYRKLCLESGEISTGLTISDLSPR